ncbi:2'-5' RNA ligase family protein [Flaviflexus massiliensis]|uniref:2'-5' RNA ligase family protein n=1 Tax=Flaviflexus massiliensis TaxID=1522309 RepID=UPI0006D5AE3C|nr:2'-5' RNA ligase family protein [Flaviflexus massiliensis]
MASPQNILLYLPPDQERQVNEIFDALEARGFPRQRQTPHISITFSQSMAPAAVEHAAQTLPGVIPAEFQRVGTVVFGTRGKQTVAWLLETGQPMWQVAREISALNPDHHRVEWIPHLTMGSRIPREMVPEYIASLDEVTPRRFKHVCAHRAGFWMPTTRQYRALAGPHE